MATNKFQVHDFGLNDHAMSLREVLRRTKGTKVSPESYAEIGAIENLRDGLLGKAANPRVFLPHALYLYEKYKDYKLIATKIGGKCDDHTVQQWVRVAQAVVQEPEIIDYLSERPTRTTLTVTKAYRIISKFQDPYVSLKVIELLAGVGDREIAEILRMYEQNPKLSIRKCRELVIQGVSRSHKRSI